ncbi:MAG TPA: hypothetical protein VGQ36_04005 [Thermoanaerobaculia bacterium]|jgi:uncharacterized membrane protein|nr:hypothetical protein [Thermoanaerobaculia bacterium]
MMVLFMEGGCDFGQSNVFFHSKLGLLIALTSCSSRPGKRAFAKLPASRPT